MKKQIGIGIATISAALVLVACGDNQEEHQTNHVETEEQAHMNHTSSGELPEGLQEKTNPVYPVGSQAILKTDHMQGMNGAEATIVGAYSTTVYAVTYTPTTGGDKVTNHKWVIHEELKGTGEQPFAKNDHVVLEANHMEGMDGAEATIDSAEKTTVYMVDYTFKGEKVKNHKWVTESELSPGK